MRILRWTALLILAAAAAACPQREQPTMPETGPAVTIDSGQTVLAEFAADGQWHLSGFRARMGDRLSFRLVGAAEGLGPGAVFLMVGRTTPQTVRGAAPQRVDKPGPIRFRISKHAIQDYDQPTIQVEIANQGG